MKYLAILPALVLLVGSVILLNSYVVAKGESTEPTVIDSGVVGELLDNSPVPPSEAEQEIRQIAREMNFDEDYLWRLCYCESGGNNLAVGDGSYYSRGLFQISYYYHPYVSDEQAFDVRWSTVWTINKLKNGENLWTCQRYI